MSMARFTAIVHQEDDMYVAFCPEIGTTSQGSSKQEAIANLKEATTLCLEEFPEKKSSRSTVTTFEVRGAKT